MNSDVQRYIAGQNPVKGKILQKLRMLIKKIAPLAQECMHYGVPAFKIHNDPLIMYAAFKNHIGIYPQPETVQAFAKELEAYKSAKGSIRFMLSEPIPYPLIKKIITYRYKKLETVKKS